MARAQGSTRKWRSHLAEGSNRFARGCAFGLLLALAACERDLSPAEKAAEEARDVAQVEAIERQRPPPVPLLPQTIRFDDIQANKLFGAGCAFAPGASMGAVLLAQPKAAYMKLDNRMVRLASDPGSTELPLGAWSRYTGREFAVSLTKSAGGGEPQGAETLRWPGRLTITDPFDQIIYDEDGSVQCSS